MYPGYNVNPGTSFRPPIAIPSVEKPGYYIVYRTYYLRPGREGIIYWSHVKNPGDKIIFDVFEGKRALEQQQQLLQPPQQNDGIPWAAIGRWAAGLGLCILGIFTAKKDGGHTFQRELDKIKMVAAVCPG